MSKETGGPAFPGKKMVYRAGFETKETEPTCGMTLRQYAAIKLKVPDSGIDWLDEMIVKSNRDDFAVTAMQNDSSSSMSLKDCAEWSYKISDAMLEVQK